MNDHRHIRVRWLHAFPNDPVELWSELDDRRFEIRKVEIWADGRVGYASRDEQAGGTMLGIEPVPPPGEIAADPQFVAERISASEFEVRWRARRG